MQRRGLVCCLNVRNPPLLEARSLKPKGSPAMLMARRPKYPPNAHDPIWPCRARHDDADSRSGRELCNARPIATVQLFWHVDAAWRRTERHIIRSRDIGHGSTHEARCIASWSQHCLTVLVGELPVGLIYSTVPDTGTSVCSAVCLLHKLHSACTILVTLFTALAIISYSASSRPRCQWKRWRSARLLRPLRLPLT